MLGGRKRAPEANAEEVAGVRERRLADRALHHRITGRENQLIEWAGAAEQVLDRPLVR
jgi:hypothetical protein